MKINSKEQDPAIILYCDHCKKHKKEQLISMQPLVFVTAGNISSVKFDLFDTSICIDCLIKVIQNLPNFGKKEE